MKKINLFAYILVEIEAFSFDITQDNKTLFSYHWLNRIVLIDIVSSTCGLTFKYHGTCLHTLYLSYVTFQENIEIWSHNTGLINIKCTVKGNKN